MAWLINKSFATKVRGVKWARRSGSLHIETNGSDPMCIIGAHIGHGDSLCEDLNVMTTLCKARTWGSKVLMVGDWNVDMLPAEATDPWAS